MDMHVDEPGDDVVTVKCEVRIGVAADGASGRMSAMRPPSTTSVPGDRTASGSTNAAPDRTIMEARADETRGADRGGVVAERRRSECCSASSIGLGSRREISVAQRLEQQVGGRRHDPAEHEHLGIGDDDQVRRRHAKVFRGVANHGDRHAVALARGLEHVLRP